MQSKTPLSTRRSIETSEDVKKMVDAFYARVREDNLIGPIFDEIVKVDWEAHLPRMYVFWETVAFNHRGYKGNPIARHRAVSRLTPLESEHFDRWLALFVETVDSLFEGRVASMVKRRARSISQVLLHKCTEQVFE